DSLALDLLEPLRPIAERHVALLLQTRYFRANDFHETRQGACRLLAPLTHELAQWMPTYAQNVAAHAETVAHIVATNSPGDIALRTPLSRDNTKRQQSIGRRSANRKSATAPLISPTCRTCGVELSERSRQLCSACWPVTRQRLATERAATANKALAAQRAAGQDPTNTPAAAAKRSQSLSKRKHEESSWRPNAEDTSWTKDRYQAEVLPALAGVPLSALMRATGLSVSACSRIRSGQLIPHHRHWRPLLEIASEREHAE
ncbi:MAG: CRISPR-associated endonuclease Cas1, partial [Nocardioidaceae bacterium]|nr:CRISPR-associated endonuclease Cas1 [Nocardioidaceae bacterium]